MRELTQHKVNGCNEALKIEVLDEPGSGGANHHYHIGVPFKNPVERYPLENSAIARTHVDIRFQNGPIPEVGTNGLTHEALLAIIIDRLEGFQKGPYACRENALALTKIEEAMHWLHHRTNKRLARGVEGTHTV